MKNFKKIMAFMVTGVFMAGVLSGCGSSVGNPSSTSEKDTEKTEISGKIGMSGSTSMEEFAKAIAEGFNAKYPNVSIDVQLGGSSTGIKNTQTGVSDIGNVSRALKDTETGLNATIVALDGIAVIVNTKNTIEDLTAEQIHDIYVGKITNWKELGGSDGKITVVGREAGSGTRDGFEGVAGIKDDARHDQELTSTGAVQTAVASTPGAIGYVSFANINDTVKTLKIGGVAPSESTVKDGSYTFQRPFVMVTNTTKEIRPEVQTFLDFILSDEGQSIASQIGLVSVGK
ncbi:MAG: phosphate ABC transporter substrate-binding protein [Oscillospiraceae bacterium]